VGPGALLHSKGCTSGQRFNEIQIWTVRVKVNHVDTCVCDYTFNFSTGSKQWTFYRFCSISETQITSPSLAQSLRSVSKSFTVSIE
jgi:hypothetical protein